MVNACDLVALAVARHRPRLAPLTAGLLVATILHAAKRHGVTYDRLVERLAKIGVDDTAVNIRNKVARGRFTAVFLVQCLESMGVRELRI